jgi:hypothetical protein
MWSPVILGLAMSSLYELTFFFIQLNRRSSSFKLCRSCR